MGASTISYIFELLEFSKFIYQLKNSWNLLEVVQMNF